MLDTGWIEIMCDADFRNQHQKPHWYGLTLEDAIDDYENEKAAAATEA